MTQETREVITFNNGARLVLDPMPGYLTASAGVCVGAGARDESEAENGLAHFLEHMAFKSAAGVAGPDLITSVEDKGGEINASTGYERTFYSVRCMGEDVAQLLRVASNVALASDLPEEDFRLEKDVVYQEINEAADLPEDLVFELAQKAAWPDHALGRSILGTKSTLEPLGREHLKRFIAQNYTPDRTIMTVAGGFDRQQVVDLAEQVLGVMVDVKPPVRTSPTHASAALTKIVDTDQAHLVLSAPAPDGAASDRFAARLFEEIFGGGMASRLYREVREKRGLAYTIDAEFDSYDDTGRLNVYCGCNPGEADDVQRIVRDIWSDLASKGPTLEELARAKAVKSVQFALASESVAARASSSAYELLTFGRLLSVEDVMQSIDDVTIEDVSKMALTALNGPRAGAYVGPKSGADAASNFISTR